MLTRKSPKSLLNGSLLFLGLENLFGRRTRRGHDLRGARAVAVWLIVQRDGRITMAAFPPAQAIQNFGKRNPENPGFQSRFAFEPGDVAEDLQEDLLNDV